MLYMPYYSNIRFFYKKTICLERKNKMKTLKDYINEQMENEEFRNEYEKLQPEFEIIRAIVEARNSRHLTQKELSVLTGINQADISKIENGTRNPSLNMIKRLAEGMNMRLELNFIPKEKTKNIC